MSHIASFLTSSSLGNFALTNKRLCTIARRQPLHLKCSLEHMLIFSEYANVYSFSVFVLSISRTFKLPRTLCVLNLISVTSIEDVSYFGDVHVLSLGNCSNVIDVSPLSKVHTLSLSDCNSLTDVSALGSVHTLSLSDCNSLTDVSSLGGVHSLDLSYTRVKDVSALGGVHSLKLEGCEELPIKKYI